MRGLAEGRRVVRGGSWNNNQNNARCACRNRNNPDNWNNNLGLRLVASHVLPRLAGNAARSITPRAAEALKHGAACSWPFGASERANIATPRSLL